MYALLTALLAIPVSVGAFINLPPLLVAWLAGRRCADDTNVIALWRILAGVPMLVLWSGAWLIAAAVLGKAWVALAYLACTWVAVRGWYRLKKLGVAAWNGVFHSGLQTRALRIHQQILSELDLRQRTPNASPL